MDALPAIPATADARRPALDEALQALRAADPGFELQAFLDDVQRRFVWERQVISRRAPNELEAFVSPALLERLRDDARRQAEAGVHTEYRALRVDGVRPIWLVVGPVRDRFTAAIDHTTSTTGIQDATGQVLFGGRELPGVEYWTLGRQSGSPTPAAGATAECPSCGAPVDRSLGVVCPYCRAELPTALSGWQLERIDQEIEWAEVPVVISPAEAEERRQERDEDDWLDAQLRGQGSRY